LTVDNNDSHMTLKDQFVWAIINMVTYLFDNKYAYSLNQIIFYFTTMSVDSVHNNNIQMIEKNQESKCMINETS
jgi:hypothetical protein